MGMTRINEWIEMDTMQLQGMPDTIAARHALLLPLLVAMGLDVDMQQFEDKCRLKTGKQVLVLRLMKIGYQFRRHIMNEFTEEYIDLGIFDMSLLPIDLWRPVADFMGPGIVASAESFKIFRCRMIKEIVAETLKQIPIPIPWARTVFSTDTIFS